MKAEIKNNTHLVIKKEDIKKLSEGFKKVLLKIEIIINHNRKQEGKRTNNKYIICNTDEPYADKVLNIILEEEGKKS